MTRLSVANLLHFTFRAPESDLLRAGWSGDRLPVEGGKIFRQPSRLTLRPAQTPTQRVPNRFPGGVTRPRPGVDHPPSSAEVKERVKLYLYSSSGPSWNVLGRTLPPSYVRAMCTAVLSVTQNCDSYFK